MALEQSSKYRCLHDIQSEILLALAEGPRSQTYVSYKVFLSYQQIKKYGESLRELGYIAIGKDKVWTITAKGRNYIEQYKEFKEAVA